MKKSVLILLVIMFAQFSYPQTTATASMTAPPTTQTKKTPTKTNKVNSFFSNFNVMGKVQTFLDAMKKQNVNAIEAAETGDFSKTVLKRRPAAGAAGEVQKKLDQLQAEKIKKYDQFN